MIIQKRALLSKRRRQHSCRCCGLSLKDGLQFLSALILPLMLGVFTIVITFQQQKLSRDQRMEDMQVARQQRIEDRNELRLQREQEWKISQMAQLAQSKTVIDQYRDELLIAYIKEMGEMLEKKNGSLTSDSLTHTLARVKTLNTLRQLDGGRQTHIIGFLYETGLLTSTNQSKALDISTAELTDIDFRKCIPSKRIEKMSLARVYLQNCTFEKMSLLNIDFSFAVFSNVNFSYGRLSNINFSFTELSNINFISARLTDVQFTFTSLENVSFSSSSWLINVDFTHAVLFHNVNFSSSQLSVVNFTFTMFGNSDFSFARLKKVNFAVAIFNISDQSYFALIKPTFSLEHDSVHLTRFNHAKMSGTRFDDCRCQGIDFSGADLKNSVFQGTMLNAANFSHTSLQNTDFTDADIVDRQLQSALSIRDARLPNGTFGHGRNLIKNGDANCNAPVDNYWRIDRGSIGVVVFNESQCRFSVQSATTRAIMSQRIRLVDIWDSSFYVSSAVELKAQMSSGVSVNLLGKSSKGIVISERIANSTVPKRIMKLQQGMVELEVVIRFNVQDNESNIGNSWCNNVELLMDYDSSTIEEE